MSFNFLVIKKVITKKLEVDEHIVLYISGRDTPFIFAASKIHEDGKLRYTKQNNQLLRQGKELLNSSE